MIQLPLQHSASLRPHSAPELLGHEYLRFC
jgi:hypothetical protein